MLGGGGRDRMRIVMVMLVFIVYCDVCDTTCCCIPFKCYSFTYIFVHCLCSLCEAPASSLNAYIFS